jgi:hypothetical protein
MKATPRFWAMVRKASTARRIAPSSAGFRRSCSAATSPASSTAFSVSLKAGNSIAGGVSR